MDLAASKAISFSAALGAPVAGAVAAFHCTLGRNSSSITSITSSSIGNIVCSIGITGSISSIIVSSIGSIALAA